MPVEIRELVIRANVEQERDRNPERVRDNREKTEYLKVIDELREIKAMLKEKNER